MFTGDVDRMTIALRFVLCDKVQAQPFVSLLGVGLDPLTQVPNDEHDFLYADRDQLIDDVSENRLAGHVQDRLRRSVRVRPQPGPNTGDWNNGFGEVASQRPWSVSTSRIVLRKITRSNQKD